MRWLRSSELAFGLLAGILGLAGVAFGWLAPYGGGSEKVYRDGRLIAAHVFSATFAGTIGFRPAMAIISVFALLVIWVAVAAILHARSSAGDWLGMEWVATALLAVATWVSTPLLVYLFWPSALFALVSAVFGSVRNVNLRRLP